MIAFNIDWDTDGEEIDLPKEVTIPESVAKEHNAGDDTAVADYLSDEYGWCVNSLKVK
jgi:hypothetical protein